MFVTVKTSVPKAARTAARTCGEAQMASCARLSRSPLTCEDKNKLVWAQV
jgi:hypothetical protein